jgi:hypothetical protein
MIGELDGHQYGMGCLPRVGAAGQFFPVYAGEACPIVPRAEWVDQADLRWAEYADEDQAQNNSCCLTSLAIALEFALAELGRERIRLDWKTIWSKLTGGRNTGVALQTAADYVRQHGFPILGKPEVVTVAEWWDVDDHEAFISGRLRGAMGTYGRFIGRGGHAECATYFTFSGGKAVAHVRGSWGKTYGTAGWYDVPEADLARGIPVFGAILFRDLAIRPADVAQLPDVSP